ncbi:MAG: hypothetical protein WKF71_11350 [Pyrinomonadaceae bacterium]
MRVCNSHEPQERGTMILPQAQTTPRLVKSIAYKKGITILHITSARMLGAYGFMSAIFQIFERHRTVIDVVTTSEVSVSLTLDNTDSLEAVVKDLQRIGTVEIEPESSGRLRRRFGLARHVGRGGADFRGDFRHQRLAHLARRVICEYDFRRAGSSQSAKSIKRLHKNFLQTEMNLFELTKSLIDIPSVSGDEQAVGFFLRDYLEGLGWTVELQAVSENQNNVIA